MTMKKFLKCLKQFEFDMNFKYNIVYFRIQSYIELDFLYNYIKTKLELTTNDSYASFLLDGHMKTDKIDCIVYINLIDRESDIFAYRNKTIEKAIPLPYYIKDCLLINK